MLLDSIDFDGEEQNIFRGCVDKLVRGVKSDKLNKVGYITVSGMVVLEEEKE